MTNSTKIAEMLCTKFCHDIIGPVGAVSNGIEFLLEELPDLQSQAADLISASSKEAISRLQFYRQAYGQNSADSYVSLTETKELSEGYFSHGKVELNWDDEYTDLSGVNITSIQKKIILNLLIIAAGSLMKGGKVSFEVSETSATISAEGETIKLDESIEACLLGKGDPENPDPRTIQPIYTWQLLQKSGNQISINKSDTSLTLKIDL